MRVSKMKRGWDRVESPAEFEVIGPMFDCGIQIGGNRLPLTILVRAGDKPKCLLQNNVTPWAPAWVPQSIGKDCGLQPRHQDHASPHG